MTINKLFIKKNFKNRLESSYEFKIKLTKYMIIGVYKKEKNILQPIIFIINIVLKKEVEEKAIELEKAKLVPSEQPQTVDIEAIKLDQKQKNAQIQLQLDGFVEEIDQCIQIIQTKE